MIEKALIGSRCYYFWLAFLFAGSLAGLGTYIYQLSEGLHVTGLGRTFPWGMYIAQLTFMVGIAAGAVMVVLPYYLHDFKAFGSITILGEFLAIAAVAVCMLFVAADMGQPRRLINLVLHPTPRSPMFWDLVAVSGYLVLNIIISFKTLFLKMNDLEPPGWLKVLVILSIPWAFSIHIVTALLYSGLAARPFWLSAIVAPRFLASAFACGPALLIVIMLILERISVFKVKTVVTDKLATIMSYAMLTSIVFVLLEYFTVFYSGSAHHSKPFEYVLFGLDGFSSVVPITWISFFFIGVATVLILMPKVRSNRIWLTITCLCTLVGLWLDKGLIMVVAGFIPDLFGRVTEYSPTIPEIILTLGIYSFGALLFSLLCKVYLSSFPRLLEEKAH